MDRKIVPFVAGVAAAAGGAFAAARARRPKLTDSEIYGQADYDTVARQVADTRLLLPAEYHRSEAVTAIFSADAEAVRETLPSEALRLVSAGRGRCAYVVAALRHHEATIRAEDGGPLVARPYGELAIGPLVTMGGFRRPFALLRPGPMPAGIGLLVQHMPVTTREARDLGRALWGYAKFVADMEFAEQEDDRTVTVSEGGEQVLTLTATSRGALKLERSLTTLYSVLDGTLIRTELPTLAYARRRRGGATLTFGPHPVGADLRRLDISGTALGVEVSPLQRLLLPIGVPAGDAMAMEGYGGSDRERGAYRVSYPGLPAVDQYEGWADISPISGAWTAELRIPVAAGG